MRMNSIRAIAIIVASIAMYPLISYAGNDSATSKDRVALEDSVTATNAPSDAGRENATSTPTSGDPVQAGGSPENVGRNSEPTAADGGAVRAGGPSDAEGRQ